MSYRSISGFFIRGAGPENYLGIATDDLETVPTQYFKKLVNTNDLWEVHVQTGNNVFRLLGFLDGNHVVILNHVFQKKTQKTPRKEIQLAETRKREYLKRKIMR